MLTCSLLAHPFLTSTTSRILVKLTVMILSLRQLRLKLLEVQGGYGAVMGRSHRGAPWLSTCDDSGRGRGGSDGSSVGVVGRSVPMVCAVPAGGSRMSGIFDGGEGVSQRR